MTREQITKGMPLLLAAKTEFEAMAETARCAIHYCYDQEAQNRTGYGTGDGHGYLSSHHGIPGKDLSDPRVCGDPGPAGRSDVRGLV